MNNWVVCNFMDSFAVHCNMTADPSGLVMTAATEKRGNPVRWSLRRYEKACAGRPAIVAFVAVRVL